MRKRALRKDFYMEIRKTLNRFVSIFLIVMLGVAFYSGIQSAAPDMRYTGDAYFDENHLMDLKVISTLGLTGGDVETIAGIEGVEKAEAGYMTDVLCGEDTQQKVLHVESISPTLNRLTAVEGRVPEKAGECFVDIELLDQMGLEIGDTISFYREDEEDYVLKTHDFIIVGAGSSPLYISFNRGNTTLGTGELAGVGYVLSEDFDMEVYTQAYLRVKGADNLTAYTDAYDSLIEKVQNRVEAIARERCDIRYREVMEEAAQEIAEAESELADGKEEAESELTDAWEELYDGEQELLAAKLKLARGKRDLADAEQKVSDGEQELADGEQEFSDNEQKLADGRTQLADGWAQLRKGKTELASKKKEFDRTYAKSMAQIEDGEQQLAQGRTALEKGRDQYEQGLAEYQKNYSDYEAGEKAYAAGLAEYEKNVTAWPEQRKALEERQAGLQRNLEELQGAIAQCSQKLPALQQAYDGAMAEVEKVQAQVQELQGEQAQLEAERQSLVSQRQTLEAEKNTLEGEKAALEGEKTALEGEKAALEGEKNALAGERQSCEKQLPGLQDRVGELRRQREAAQQRLAVLQGKPSEELTDAERQELAGLPDQIAGLDGQIDSVNSQIAALQNEIARIEGILAEKEAGISHANSQIVEKEAAITAKGTQITQKSGEITEKDAQIGDKDAQISRKAEEVLAASQPLAALQAQAEEYRKPLTALQSQIEEFQGQAAQVQAGIDQIVTGISTGEQELANGKAALDENRAKLDSAKTQLEQGKAVLDESIAEIEAQEKVLTQKEDELKSGKQQLEEGKRQLAAAQRTIAANERKLADSQAELADAEVQLQDGRRELEDARQELKDAKEELADAKKELSDGEKEVAENEPKLRRGRIEYARGEKAAWDQIAEGEEKLADAKEELADLKVPEWTVSDRSTLPENIGYGENAERMRSIGQVFPVIFFLVAALISLTTMTRMVEEERTQIGTMKALGYGKGAIASKYLCYALFATLGGSVAGVLFGEKFLPFVIVTAYKIMYHHMPNMELPYNIKFALIAAGAALFSTMAATLAACFRVLADTPAVLMRPPAPKEGKRVLLERIPFLWKHLSFTWKSTIRNLFRYKKRFFMTVIGMGGCMALMLVGYGLRDSISDIAHLQFETLQLYDGMVILDTDAKEEQTRELMQAIRQDSGIEASTETLMKKVDVRRGKKLWNIYIMVPENLQEAEGFLHFRDRKSKESYQLTDEGAILTEKIASLMGVHAGDTITLEDEESGAVEVPVLAVTENYLSHYIYMTPALYEKCYGKQPEYNEIMFRAKEEVSDLNAMGETFLRYDAALSVTYSATLMNQLDTMLSTLDSVIIVLIVSAGMLAFVVLYNLSNININERKRELATLKVLGFYNGEVDAYVYRENILITMIGIAAGVFLGKILHYFVITTVEVDATMFGRNINLPSFVIAGVYTAVFSVLVNVFMHFKLKKIDMVESLKSVE